MEIVLPEGPGWSAMHLADRNWGATALIVKREHDVTGRAATPRAAQEGIVLSDTLIEGDPRAIIVREAETALFKARPEALRLGYGTGGVVQAQMRVSGTVHRTLVAGAVQDPVNLFGFEPRTNRVGGFDPDGFDYDADGPALFRSARRTEGWSVPADAALAGDVRVEVTVTGADGGGPVMLDDVTVRIPRLVVTPFVWEGRRNDPAYWCRRAPTEMTADTLILTGPRLHLIWRAALPMDVHPPADLRRVVLKAA